LGISATISSGLSVPVSSQTSQVYADERKASAAAEVVCYETYFDGIDDRFVSTNAAFKIGTFSALFQLKPSAFGPGLKNLVGMLDGGSETSGWRSWINSNGTVATRVFTSSVSNTSSALSIGTYYDVIVTYDGTELEVWLDGVSQGTATGAMVTPTYDYHFGGGSFQTTLGLNGYLKNVTYMDDKVTNPASWDPDDPSTLTGASLICHNPKGNEENDQGISFTKYGAPSTALCA